ncbi:MAG: DUF3793 family protein [Clostridiales bacterium]|nr:DUF3793 family protein [Clostridiales bacterium]
MSEQLLINQCSPTLAGIKTGNLFTSPSNGETLLRKIRYFNRKYRSKGLRLVALKLSQKRSLVYIYRPQRLKDDLSDESSQSLLEERGYPTDKPEKCLAEISKRLREGKEFPHEIGLFLGYPPEDVRGFIENRGAGAKLSGLWKVYGDPEKAGYLFALYKKCTDIYQRAYSLNAPFERLVVDIKHKKP